MSLPTSACLSFEGSESGVLHEKCANLKSVLRLLSVKYCLLLVLLLWWLEHHAGFLAAAAARASAGPAG
jgi:hypothetical protein